MFPRYRNWMNTCLGREKEINFCFFFWPPLWVKSWLPLKLHSLYKNMGDSFCVRKNAAFFMGRIFLHPKIGCLGIGLGCISGLEADEPIPPSRVWSVQPYLHSKKSGSPNLAHRKIGDRRVLPLQNRSFELVIDRGIWRMWAPQKKFNDF